MNLENKKGDISTYKLLQKYTHESKKIAWNGSYPLPGMTAIQIAAAQYCRVQPELHQQFDLVLSIEEGLDSFGNSWEAQLDELTRLLRASGTLILKFKQTNLVNLISVKRFLWRSLILEVKLTDQWIDNQQDIFMVINVKRKNFDSYKKEKWTFALITDGQRNKNVEKFIKSVQIQAAGPHEILIVGPKAKYKGARIIEFANGDLPRIAEKKNIIGLEAANQNICISHDRYKLDRNFVSNWKKFGYDFDFCTVAQRTQTGEIYPSLVSLPQKIEQWQSPEYFNDGVYADGNFINGGFFIIKKHLISDFPMNSLSLHNEAEDVEYSWSLRYGGVSTRINAFSRAIVIGNPSLGGYSRMNSVEPTRKTFAIKFRKLVYVFYRKLPQVVKKSSAIVFLKDLIK